MSAKREIILASASPRRKQLLEYLGLSFTIAAADVDETILATEQPVAAAKRLAEKKGDAVSRLNPSAIVIAADTIVVLPKEDRGSDGKILGKPASESQAIEMLESLQGIEHIVVTAYCVCCLELDRKTVSHAESRVKFKNLTRDEIQSYVATGEPMDKAGSYGIQEIGAFLVERVSGSYTNVVGLPVSEVCEELKLWHAWSAKMLPSAACK